MNEGGKLPFVHSDTDAPMAKSSSSDWLQVSITLGVVLLLFGLQLRTVEAFVCTPPATEVLTNWFGAAENSAQGALQRMVVEKTGHRHIVEPPSWLGWAMMSLGFVLFMHGLWGKIRR
jgi:hypothetical protein